MRIEQRRISHQHVLWQGVEGFLKKKTTMYHQDAPNETKDADILHTPRQAAENRHNNNKQ